MSKLPTVPRCMAGLSQAAPDALARMTAAASTLTAYRALQLGGGDRLVVLLNAMVAEVMDSAGGEEDVAVEYLCAMLGHLVGYEIGRRAGLASMTPQGRA